VKTFSLLLQMLDKNSIRMVACSDIHEHSQLKRLILLDFSKAFLWHSICCIPRHELPSRIQALPIQRVVLTDWFPFGDVQSAQQPDHSASSGRERVKSYTVYRFDYNRQMREPVGKLEERRRKDRGNNIEALLRLAQKLYSTSSLDSHIIITPE
jgi:hypothetical protein